MFDMETIKRQLNNISDDNEASKRKKIQNTKSSITTPCLIEHLSNELFYEIFEYLDYHHAFYAFYDLNQRFRNLFTNSNSLINVNLKTISKKSYENYAKYFLIPQNHRIETFHLSNPFAADMLLLLLPTMASFIRLKTLIATNVEASYIDHLVNHLSLLPILSSLTITSIDYIRNQNEIYQKLFSLPELKYCQMSLETLKTLEPLKFATTNFSPIEHLVINNKISSIQIPSLLSYVPRLRRLSLNRLEQSRYNLIPMNQISLNDLTDVSIKLNSFGFDSFEQLIKNCFHQITILRIVICMVRYFMDNSHFLNASRWEKLILTHMPNLSTFDFQYQYRIWDFHSNMGTFKNLIQTFNSTFWRDRQWIFECQYYSKGHRQMASFYSVNEFRRKYHMLYEEKKHAICSQERSIQHVYIHNIDAMKQFPGYFLNANEVSLTENFIVSRNSIVPDLKRIIPLTQLTKLSINCLRFAIDQIIELLRSTPNVHTLQLDAVLFYRADSSTIRQSEIFHEVATMNNILNVTIHKESTLEKIQLLIALCPRLESLTINLFKEDFEIIVRFLLLMAMNNRYRLSALCITKQRNEFLEKLKTLMETEKFSVDLTVKFIHRKLYLWW